MKGCPFTRDIENDIPAARAMDQISSSDDFRKTIGLKDKLYCPRILLQKLRDRGLIIKLKVRRDNQLVFEPLGISQIEIFEIHIYNSLGM